MERVNNGHDKCAFKLYKFYIKKLLRKYRETYVYVCKSIREIQSYTDRCNCDLLRALLKSLYVILC